MKNKELLCVSRNGKKVYWDSVNSHAVTHFADTPNLKKLVIEILENRDLDFTNLEFDLDVKRIIGTTDVTVVNDADEIIYAIRKNRKDQGYVPFTKSRKAQNSSYISIALVLNDDNSYNLSSAWIGKWDDPPFPQQTHATAESKDYWNTHAFVWGSQEIESGTETKVRPW
jgi:hypothetical protein